MGKKSFHKKGQLLQGWETEWDEREIDQLTHQIRLANRLQDSAPRSDDDEFVQEAQRYLDWMCSCCGAFQSDDEGKCENCGEERL